MKKYLLLLLPILMLTAVLFVSCDAIHIQLPFATDSSTDLSTDSSTNSTDLTTEAPTETSALQATCQHINAAENVIKPTCTTDGITMISCFDCGLENHVIEIVPASHTFEITQSIATCVTPGQVTKHCTICNIVETFENELGAHEFEVTSTTSTCEVAGTDTLTCKLCQATDTAEGEALGHEIKKTTVAAKCTTQGYTLNKCTREGCTYSKKTNVKKSLGHKYTAENTKILKYATVYNDGSMQRTCSTCKKTTTEKLPYSSIFNGAYVNGTKIVAEGFDISAWQDGLTLSDFKKIKASGISYVILRAGRTPSVKDSNFEQFYSYAKEAGLDVGAYFYSSSPRSSGTITEADVLQDAEDCLSMIAGKKFEYPIYYDLEDSTYEKYDNDTKARFALLFCEALQKEGYYAGVYCSTRWLRDKINTEMVTDKLDIWIANYFLDGSNVWNDKMWDWELMRDGKLTLLKDTPYGMWQYTDSGKFGSLSGYSGSFDRNVCYKDYPTIIKSNHLNGY